MINLFLFQSVNRTTKNCKPSWGRSATYDTEWARIAKKKSEFYKLLFKNLHTFNPQLKNERFRDYVFESSENKKPAKFFLIL